MLRNKPDAWAIVLDKSGKIAWGRSDVDGDPLVVILSQNVSDGHLVGLREDGVSYIFAGEREIDLAAALEALNRKLGIKRLLLEGGGAANGALLSAGLVDELSQVVVPSVEGVPGSPALFDIHDPPGALAGMGMELMSAQVLEGGCVWAALPLLVDSVIRPSGAGCTLREPGSLNGSIDAWKGMPLPALGGQV